MSIEPFIILKKMYVYYMYRIIFFIFIIFSLSDVYPDENSSFIDKSTIENSINDGFYTFAEEKCRNIIPNLSKKIT